MDSIYCDKYEKRGLAELMTQPFTFYRNAGRVNRTIDQVDRRVQFVKNYTQLGTGLAAAAGVAAAVVAAKLSEDSFVESLVQKPLVFPSDLDKYSLSMAFDFKKYERRSIFRQPYMRPQGTIRLPISKNIKDHND